MLPVVTVMVFSFGNKNSTMAITAHQPVHERTSVWQLDEANRSRNSETKITAFLTSAKRNEYARLRAHEVYPLIEGQPGKASARLIETTSKTKLAEFLGMTGEQTRSMQAEVTGRQPFTKIGIPLSLHGWAEFEISTMSSWTRFTLDHTTRKDGLVCWVSKRKPESELEPVEPPPMKGSGPYVIRMTYHQLADPRFVVKVQACSRRWIKLRQIWRGEPRVQFVAALWKPEERCYLDGVVGSAQGEDYSHFELGKVSEDELDAARIDVIRLTDTQIVREEFADESVIVYLPKP